MIRLALFCGVILGVAPALAQPAGPMLVSVAALAGLLRDPNVVWPAGGTELREKK
jgi:hypothetical protein